MASYSTRWIDPEGNTHYFHGLAKTTYLSDGKDVEAALGEKAGKGDIPESIPWGSVTGKPSTFTPASHNHGAGEITTGTLPVARGGTGAGTAAAALTSIGAAPASHSHGAGDITSGTLPIARGGTGATAAAAALAALGGVALPTRATFSFSGSCSANGTSGNELIKIGNLVCANIGVHSTAKLRSDQNISVTIPSGYRPTGSVTVAAVFGDGVNPPLIGTLAFNNGGTIYINYDENSYDARYVWATLCYWTNQ